MKTAQISDFIKTKLPIPDHFHPEPSTSAPNIIEFGS
jgi:hypothetical protein